MKRQLTLQEFVSKARKIERQRTFTGFNVVNTPSDGSCMFAAIAHQTSLLKGSESETDGSETTPQPARGTIFCLFLKLII